MLINSAFVAQETVVIHQCGKVELFHETHHGMY